METIVSENIEEEMPKPDDPMQSNATTLDNKELYAVIDDLVNSCGGGGDPSPDVHDEFLNFSESIVVPMPSPNGSDIENAPPLPSSPPLLPPIVAAETEPMRQRKFDFNNLGDLCVPYDPTENSKVTIKYTPSKIKILENRVIKNAAPKKKLSLHDYMSRRKVLGELMPQEEDVKNIPLPPGPAPTKHEPIIVKLPLKPVKRADVRIAKKTISKDDMPPKNDEITFESSDSEDEQLPVEKNVASDSNVVARKRERLASNASQRSRSRSSSSSSSSSSRSSSCSSSKSNSGSESSSGDSSSDSEHEESSDELNDATTDQVDGPQTGTSWSPPPPPPSPSIEVTVESSASPMAIEENVEGETDEQSQQQQQQQQQPMDIEEDTEIDENIEEAKEVDAAIEDDQEADEQPQPSSSSSSSEDIKSKRHVDDLEDWCKYKAYSYVLVDDSDDFTNVTLPNVKLAGEFNVKPHVHQCSEGGASLKSLIDVNFLTKSELDQLKSMSRKYKTAQVSALNCNEDLVSTKTRIKAVNANCIEYPEQLDLVSIRDIIKSLGYTCDDIKLAPSALGTALKKISREYLTHALYRKECVNNNEYCMSVYPFVYGAVPKEMSKFVKHLIVTGLRDYKLIQTAKSEGRTSAVIKKFPKNAVPFFDGEIEASAHIYWQLYSLDLLNWKDDVTRSQLKRILEYACWLIPKTNKKNSDLRTLIAKYANFKTKFITAECLLIIKSLYRSILLTLESLKTSLQGIDAYNRAVTVWDYFMQQCKIHHYLCPHTKNAIAKHLDRYKIQIPYKLESVMAQNMHNNCLLTLSASEVYSILRVWKSMGSVNDVDRDLQLTMSDLYVFFAKLFANHIVGTGIYDVSNNGVIDSIKVVQYFAERYSDILNFNQNIHHADDAISSSSNIATTEYFPVFGKKISDELKKIILLELNDIYTINPNGVSQLKLGADVMTAFLRVANAGLFKALSPLIYMHDTNSKCPSALIVEAITKYFEMDAFTRFKASELWSRYTDDDVDEIDESGNVICPFLDSDDDDDVDTDSEYSDVDETKTDDTKKDKTQNDDTKKDETQKDDTKKDDTKEDEDEDDLLAELEDLKKMAETPLLPFCKNDQVPIKTRRRPYVKKESASSSSTSTSSNKNNEIPLRYKLAAENISRGKCVMCYKATTAKSVHVESDIPILVHCCLSCHARINDDTDASIDHEAIVQRIKCRVAPPIAFSKETNCFLLNYELSGKRAHFDYNKLSPSVLNRKRKAAEANKNAKKPKVVAESVNETNISAQTLD